MPCALGKDPRMHGLESERHEGRTEPYARTSFPDTKHHIQCHKALVAEALDMSERFDRNELSVGELFSFLAHEIVAQHVLREDKKFFPYLSAVPPQQSDAPTRPHQIARAIT